MLAQVPKMNKFLTYSAVKVGTAGSVWIQYLRYAIQE